MAIASDSMAIAAESMVIAALSIAIAAETMAIAADNQTWAHDTFKISSSRPSSYFYIQDKNLVLCSLKKQAQARISSFKKVQARILCVNQAQASKMRVKRFKYWAKTQNISSFNSTCWLDIK